VAGGYAVLHTDRVATMSAVGKCIYVIRLQLGPFAVHGSVELTVCLVITSKLYFKGL
jgi:hypothetical protein